MTRLEGLDLVGGSFKAVTPGSVALCKQVQLHLQVIDVHIEQRNRYEAAVGRVEV